MTGKLTNCVVARNMVVAAAIMAIWRAVCMVVRFSCSWGLWLQTEWRIIVGVVERVGHGTFGFAREVCGFVWIWALLDEDKEEGLS